MRNLAIRSSIFTLLLLACAGPALAQERQVTGTVTDASSGLALPGVNIVVEGTTTGTTTNLDGNYTLTVPGPEAVLVFSFVGYETQTVTVGNQEVINVALQEDIALLEDVVVVGYGTQRRQDVTSSVTTINAEDANVGLVTSPDQMIQGRVAGVTIVQNNGEPGAGVQVRIRGGTSISASNEPLYVIDGVPIDNARNEPGGANISRSAARNPLSMLNPNDIESITILKDASATAIYGSRGANGVVLITTKKGVAGQMAVDYEGYVSASSSSRKLDLLSASEYRSFLEDQINAGEIEPRDDNENSIPDQLEALGTADTDWQDAVMRTGVSHFHNLAFSGGTASTQYRASLSYLDNEGHVISSGLERVTARLNGSHQALADRLRLNMNVQAGYVTNDYIAYEQTGGFEGGLFTNVFMFNPTQPVRVDDETFYEIGPGRQGVRNPVAIAEQIDDFGKTTRALGNLSAELDLIGGLTAQINVGADRNQGSRRMYFPRSNPLGAEFNGQALQRNRERSSVTLQSYLTYQGILAQVHSLNLLGGYEFNDYMTEEFGAEARDFVTDFWRYNNLGGGAQEIKPYSFKETNRLVSFFGRANYNFNEKYYLSGTLRYDGSSRFGAGNKWALFPAVSAAWRLSEEPFLQGAEAISDLRFRVNFGIIGNQEIGNYNSLALLRPDPGARAVIGERPVTGVAPVTFANPNLRWEEKAEFNVAIDYGFMNNRFSGTLEYYNNRTYDLLLTIPVPQPAVVSERLENIGEVQNQGVELSLDALAFARPDFDLLFGLVFSTNRNEVVDLGARDRIFTGSVSGRGQSGVQSQIILPGQPLGTFYGFEFAGINEEGVQVFNDYENILDDQGNVVGQRLVGATTDPQAGDDRVILGNAQPDFTYGFRAQTTWRNLDLSLFLRGEVGRDIFNNTALVYQTKSAVLQGQNFIRDALNDPDAVQEAAKFSNRWIEDGSFLRLDNVTVGYTIQPGALAGQLRSARVYVSAQNVLTLTGYSGYDPEVHTGDAGLAALGIDYTNYPRARTFTLGVNLGF